MTAEGSRRIIINFNPGEEGRGFMEPQRIIIPEGQISVIAQLNFCRFSARDAGVRFIGWSGSNGKCYTDLESAAWTESEDGITLTAQWAEISRLYEGKTITLNGYYRLSYDIVGHITVEAGVLAVIDLEGKKLDAKRNSSAIINKGALTLTDTTDNKGRITGGKSNKGGGVYVTEGSTFTMNNGVISGNNANQGGGVYVDKNSNFTMNSGRISGNNANQGGGIYVDKNSNFTMNSGRISGNSVDGNGGGVYNNEMFTMKSGTITKNSAENGGGVYNNEMFTMNNGEINGNNADKEGGECITTSAHSP